MGEDVVFDNSAMILVDPKPSKNYYRLLRHANLLFLDKLISKKQYQQYKKKILKMISLENTNENKKNEAKTSTSSKRKETDESDESDEDDLENLEDGRRYYLILKEMKVLHQNNVIHDQEYETIKGELLQTEKLEQIIKEKTKEA